MTRQLVIDKRKAARLRSAQKRMLKADLKSQQARMSYHTAIGEVAVSGATVREIGKELGLSHQRVHQILEGMSCDFCGAPRREAHKMIAAGRGGHICDLCVVVARTAIRTQAPASDGRTTLRLVSRDDPRTCTFCGSKQTKRSKGMVGHKVNRICNPCLRLCGEILEEERRKDSAK